VAPTQRKSVTDLNQETQMARGEELEIEIDATGQVRVLTKGIKGKKCLDYVEIFRQLLGRVEDQELTPEFNQVEGHVEVQNQTHVRNRFSE
jgi:TusA-related sulfurtransferase